jgi:hypothetical protein
VSSLQIRQLRASGLTAILTSPKRVIERMSFIPSSCGAGLKSLLNKSEQAVSSEITRVHIPTLGDPRALSGGDLSTPRITVWVSLRHSLRLGNRSCGLTYANTRQSTSRLAPKYEWMLDVDKREAMA